MHLQPFTILTLLATLTTTTTACRSKYHRCKCFDTRTNAPNDNISKKVCTNTAYTNYGAKWSDPSTCNAPDGKKFDNCLWREHCNVEGGYQTTDKVFLDRCEK
ncbi:hypothetical protein Tdes44962_MAKER06149 [Teratosphaeria destructans]|uniref:Secreted protein n=1 Tax=Teratosphaeria destructans TaxID=418781 RepID=A0A9W7SI20_9PEZI|nr:hypothetical protein Tdes44962_MAKER06149 [Teratosphaeria destructans]